MKKSRYTETQIIKVLKKVGGQPIRTQLGDAAIVAVPERKCGQEAAHYGVVVCYYVIMCL